MVYRQKVWRPNRICLGKKVRLALMRSVSILQHSNSLKHSVTVLFGASGDRGAHRVMPHLAAAVTATATGPLK